MEEYLEKVASGETLEYEDFEQLVGMTGPSPTMAYEIMHQHAENLDEIDGFEAVNLMMARGFAEEQGITRNQDTIEEHLRSYFKGRDLTSEQKEFERLGMPESLSVNQVRESLGKIHDEFSADEYDNEVIYEEERNYLVTVRGLVEEFSV
ncbi:MAG: hypothetical protein ABEK10_03655 [Candidatus Nanosalina sp.]